MAQATGHRDALHARAEFLCSEEFDALIGELQFDVARDLDAARSSFERGLRAASGRKGRAPALAIAIRFADVLRRAGRLGDAADVLREAMDGFPAPHANHRYAEASALLADIASSTPISHVATRLAEGEEHAH